MNIDILRKRAAWWHAVGKRLGSLLFLAGIALVVMLMTFWSQIDSKFFRFLLCVPLAASIGIAYKEGHAQRELDEALEREDIA